LPQRRLHHHHLQRHHPVALLRQHLPGSSGSKFPPFLQISTSHLQSRSSPKSPKEIGPASATFTLTAHILPSSV
jgi:hypothetical protein